MSTLKGRPGSVLWLMGNELRLSWRRGRMGPKTGLILLGLLLVFYLGMTFLVFRALGPMIPAPPIAHTEVGAIALAFVDILMGFMASVMISGSILAAVDAIYTRNDLDLLLSSPLSPWTVLVVRSAAIAVGGLPLYAGIIIPPAVWLAVFSSPWWLSAVPALVALSFACTGIAMAIVTGLFRVIGPKRTRMVAQILSALAGATVFLIFQYPNIVGHGRGPISEEQINSFFNRLHIDPDAPWLFPARAMTGDIPWLLMWIAVCGVLFMAGVFIFSVRFVSDAAAASAMGERKRAVDMRVASVRGGETASVVRKEARLLLRDPVLLSQIGLQIVYLLPLAFVLLRVSGHEIEGMNLAAMAPAVTLLASSLAGSLVWITASAEDAPDLIASAPLRASVIERGKLIAALIPVAALMAIPVVALLALSPRAGLWALGGAVAGALSGGLIGLWRRTPGSRKNFLRRRNQGSVVSRLGQTFVALGLSATIGAGVYGYPWLALLAAILAAAVFGALYKPPSQRG